MVPFHVDGHIYYIEAQKLICFMAVENYTDVFRIPMVGGYSHMCRPCVTGRFLPQTRPGKEANGSRSTHSMS